MTNCSEQKPFWEKAGFNWHPFEYLDADHDKYLSACFVDEPVHLDTLMLNQHTALFAPLGGGKTAARRMLQSLASIAEDSEILPIVCDDFENTLSQAGNDPMQITMAMLGEEVLSEMAAVFLDIWVDEKIEIFDQTPTSARRWIACYMRNWEGHFEAILTKIGLAGVISVRDCEQPWSKLKAAVPAELAPWVKMLANLSSLRHQADDGLTLQDKLQSAMDVARQLGYSTVYVLWDKVDGLSMTSGRDSCAALVWPILDSTILLSIQGLYFKLFLPTITRERLSDSTGFRSQRVNFIDVKWDADSLRILLKERLRGASDNNVESLVAISADKSINEDEALVQYVETPRQLLRLGWQLFKHINDAGELTRDALDKTLQQARQQKKAKKREQAFRWIRTASFILGVLLLIAGLWTRAWWGFLPLLIDGFIGFLASYFIDRSRGKRYGTWNLSRLREWTLRLSGAVATLSSLYVAALVWLPPLLPPRSTAPTTIPNTETQVFISHSPWSTLGDEDNVRLTLEGVNNPITLTLKSDPVGTLEWPEKNTVVFTEAKTNALPVRFVASGQIKYSVDSECCGEHETSIIESKIAILPLPASLVSKMVALLGTITGTLITAFARQLGDWLLKVTPLFEQKKEER